MDRRPEQSGPLVPDDRRPGRGLALVTAVAAALLALVHAADLIQGVLRLPFTAHDLWLLMGRADTSGREFVLGLPWNLAQTAVLMMLSIDTLIGGLICLGRRRGAARIGGALAVLAVVLPLTVPLLAVPLVELMQPALQGSGWQGNLLYIGVPSLVSASGLVCGLMAAILLAWGRPQERQLYGTAASAVGVVLGAVFALEALAALVRQVTIPSSWWGLEWVGFVDFSPPVALLLFLLLVVVMAAAGIGSGLLLGSASLLTRLGGGLLAAALVARVATQVVAWGMGHALLDRASQTFDYTWIGLIDWTNAIAVPLLAVPGVLLAVIGLFTGPRRAPTAADGPSTSGGSSAV